MRGGKLRPPPVRGQATAIAGAEIHCCLAANFIGWERDHTLFDRELQKVICALKKDAARREKPPLDFQAIRATV